MLLACLLTVDCLTLLLLLLLLLLSRCVCVCVCFCVCVCWCVCAHVLRVILWLRCFSNTSCIYCIAVWIGLESWISMSDTLTDCACVSVCVCVCVCGFRCAGLIV